MTKRERSSQPDRPSMERSLDALLDWSLLDRGLRDRDSLDCDSLDRRAVDHDLLHHDSLDWAAAPVGHPPRWEPVAQVLAALTSAPESSELTGEARALAVFRAFAEAPAPGADLPVPAPRRNPGRMSWRPGGRLAVAAATGAVLMGGLLAVAYAGDLPVPAQRLAHDTIHAPAVRSDRDPAASSQSAGSPNPAGGAGHRATHALVGPDRQVHRGSGPGHPHRHGTSSSSFGSSPGRPGYGRLGAGRPGAGWWGAGWPGAGWPGAGRRGSGWPGQSSPSRSAEPGPTRAPAPSASIRPSASATSSPSAGPSPSHSGPPYPAQSPSGSQSLSP